jgi:hypothetical protein
LGAAAIDPLSLKAAVLEVFFSAVVAGYHFGKRPKEHAVQLSISATFQ